MIRAPSTGKALVPAGLGGKTRVPAAELACASGGFLWCGREEGAAGPRNRVTRGGHVAPCFSGIISLDPNCMRTTAPTLQMKRPRPKVRFWLRSGSAHSVVLSPEPSLPLPSTLLGIKARLKELVPLACQTVAAEQRSACLLQSTHLAGAMPCRVPGHTRTVRLSTPAGPGPGTCVVISAQGNAL